MVRWILWIGGLLVFLTGIVWILQGTNQLGGSPMSGNSFWAWAGLVVLLAGLAMLYAGIRKLSSR